MPDDTDVPDGVLLPDASPMEKSPIADPAPADVASVTALHAPLSHSPPYSLCCASPCREYTIVRFSHSHKFAFSSHSILPPLP
jgi:hypothetical protein